ncbi:MAG TPA: hypothetical protein VFJ43_09670 [Bacteroidia bacterium]|nr:hypothetical protein [Bacteroidia bacterium]
MDPNIYKSALAIHVVGITIMAGTTFVDFILSQQFWKNFSGDKTKNLIMGDGVNTLQKFIRIGLIVIVVSGVLMMAYLHQVWGQQIWFRIKMGMLLLIVINGLAIRRRMNRKLNMLINGETSVSNFNQELFRLKKNITTSQVFQMIFFTIIFVLSVFKFN